MTDPVSDMLISLKNAQKAGKESVLVSYSKFKYEVARALERAGFVKALDKKGKKIKKILEISLHAKENPKAINNVKLLSKPSRRLYVKCQDIKYKKDGQVVLIISTSKGIMTGGEAYKAQMGGQLITEIW